MEFNNTKRKSVASPKIWIKKNNKIFTQNWTPLIYIDFYILQARRTKLMDTNMKY